MKAITLKIISLVLGLLLSSNVTIAQDKQPELNWQPGPADIQLSSQAVLKLPAEYLFLEAEQAKALLRRAGNSPSDNVQGIIVPAQKDGKWFVVISYHDTGYIRDDDAKNWDADALLESIKEGTAQDNQRRKAMGIPELIIGGWAEKPTYDQSSNKVVWAVATKSTDSYEGVNFNTLALGRYGYISMNMVTDLAELTQYKSNVQTLLTQLNFVDGKRYADFNSTTDKAAAVGLAALVAGTAAKLGLFGKLWSLVFPVLLVLKKFIIYLIVAGSALVMNRLKKFRKPQIETPTQS